MRDLNDAVQPLLRAFREYGYCTDCWVNLNEEDHEDYCEVPQDNGGGAARNDPADS